MIEIRRFSRDDVAAARRLFALMAQVFEEEARPLSDAYVARLLGRPEFWAIAAFVDGDLVGGLTAHTLPMTRTESFEVFIYDDTEYGHDRDSTILLRRRRGRQADVRADGRSVH